MTAETSARIWAGVGGIVVGAVFTGMIGFQGGFWVTKTDANRSMQRAVVEDRGSICAAEFKSDAHYQDQLKAFAALNIGDRDAFIDKGGWSKMPGDDGKPMDGVAQSCGDK